MWGVMAVSWKCVFKSVSTAPSSAFPTLTSKRTWKCWKGHPPCPLSQESGIVSSYLGTKLCGPSFPSSVRCPLTLWQHRQCCCLLLYYPFQEQVQPIVTSSWSGAARSPHSSTQSSRAQRWPREAAGGGRSANLPCDLYCKPALTSAHRRFASHFLMCMWTSGCSQLHWKAPRLFWFAAGQGGASLTGSLSLLMLPQTHFLGAPH